MDRALQYLSLAKKANRAALGEEPVGDAIRAGKAALAVAAADASGHTWRRLEPAVRLRIPYSKEEMGQAVGRSLLAAAAFTDPALALAFVRALEPVPRDVEQALLARRTGHKKEH